MKKAIEKGNIEGARIYAQNAIRKKSEQLNYLRVGDGVLTSTACARMAACGPHLCRGF